MPTWLSAILLLVPLGLASPSFASEEYNDVQCQLEFSDKDLCNVKFFRNFVSVRLIKSGVVSRIPLSNVYRWSYENASLRKGNPLSPIKLFTHVEHIHIFTIFYRDKQLASNEKLIIDFDDIRYVPSMKALLSEVVPES